MLPNLLTESSVGGNSQRLHTPTPTYCGTVAGAPGLPTLGYLPTTALHAKGPTLPLPLSAEGWGLRRGTGDKQPYCEPVLPVAPLPFPYYLSIWTPVFCLGNGQKLVGAAFLITKAQHVGVTSRRGATLEHSDMPRYT